MISFTGLADSTDKARRLAEGNPTRAEIMDQLDLLASDREALLVFLNAIGQIMVHTVGNRNAWESDNFYGIGQGIAALSDILLGLQDASNTLLSKLTEMESV